MVASLNPLWSGLLGRPKTQEADQVVFFSVSIPSGRGFWAGRREGAAQPRRLRESQSPLVGASGPAANVFGEGVLLETAVSIPSGRGFWAGLRYTRSNWKH